MNRDELVEAVARAMCRLDCAFGDPEHEVSARVDGNWRCYIDQAEAVIPLIVEGCAKIADGSIWNPPADNHEASWNDACDHIANAIRTLTQNPAQGARE